MAQEYRWQYKIEQQQHAIVESGLREEKERISNHKHRRFVLRFKLCSTSSSSPHEEFSLQLITRDHHSTRSHKNKQDQQVQSLGATTPYNRRTCKLVLRTQPLEHFLITMKDVTFHRSPKWAHKYNPITKNRICSSSETVMRKALKSVELKIK